GSGDDPHIAVTRGPAPFALQKRKHLFRRNERSEKTRPLRILIFRPIPESANQGCSRSKSKRPAFSGGPSVAAFSGYHVENANGGLRPSAGPCLPLKRKRNRESRWRCRVWPASPLRACRAV